MLKNMAKCFINRSDENGEVNFDFDQIYIQKK